MLKHGIRTNFYMRNTIVISIFEYFLKQVTFVTTQGFVRSRLIQKLCKISLNLEGIGTYSQNVAFRLILSWEAE